MMAVTPERSDTSDVVGYAKDIEDCNDIEDVDYFDGVVDVDDIGDGEHSAYVNVCGMCRIR